MAVSNLVTLANLLPLPIQQFFDANGDPLSAGKVYTYASDGITPKTTWQNAAMTITQTNPVVLDIAGRPQGSTGIYGTGDYVFGVFDQFGVQQYTQPTADTTRSLGASSLGEQLIQQTSTADMQTLLGISSSPIAVGLMMFWPASLATLPAGWFPCNGTAISRVTYAALFTAIGTTWGSGDGTTTFNLPDLQGRVPAGVDGGSGRLTNASDPAFGGGAVVGNVGGSQLLTSHGHVLSLTDPGHDHEQMIAQGSGSNNAWNITGNGTPTNLGYKTSVANAGVTGSVADAGAGASQNVQPTAVGYWVIKLV